MCSDTTLVDQSVDWVIESTLRMAFDYADRFDSVEMENLLADVIHLDNIRRGVIGYKPDLTFDFAIGL